MYAVVVTVTVDLSHRAQADEDLHQRVVPIVGKAPGLVAGYWLEPSGDKGFSLLVFETEAGANGAAEMARTAEPPAYITFDSIEVREVIATAP